MTLCEVWTLTPAGKRKRIPLWLAQLRMYNYWYPRAPITLASTARFFLGTTDAPHSRERSLGEGVRTTGEHTGYEAFERLKSSWTKL